MPTVKRGVYMGGTAYVYGLVQTSTNELVYVGLTLTPRQRFACHKNSTVKDIRRDCHMVILEEGPDLTSTHENFWIHYMKYLGCNLRNKRVKLLKEDYGRQYTNHGYTYPHLVHDMAERGISVECLAETTHLDFKTIVNARYGGRISPFVALRIDRVLRLGTEIFQGLSLCRQRNLLDGLTSPATAKKYSKSLSRKGGTVALLPQQP